MHSQINELEKLKKELMDKLPHDKQKLVLESISRMSKATNADELLDLQGIELKKFKDGY